MKCFLKLLIVNFLFFISIINVSALDEFGNLIKIQTTDEIMFINDDENGNFNYSWTFDKQQYEKNEFEFDLTINFSTDENYEKLKNKSIKTIKKYIYFNHEGKIPSKAKIKIPVDEQFEEDTKLILYSYDKKTNTTNIVDNEVIVANGFVTFEIDYCMDYFVEYTKIYHNNKKEGNGFVIVTMLIMIVCLIGYTLYNKK